MKSLFKHCLVLLAAYWGASGVIAGQIDIQQYSAFLYTPSLGSAALEYDAIGYGYDDFAGSGVSINYSDSISNGLGNSSWSFQNNTGSTLDSAWLFIFLDAEIDTALTSYFNEFGGYDSVLGLGASDSAADAWEIDEPGYYFGDIYTNLLSGQLDNQNSLVPGFEDDVSMALGFNLGDVVDGATFQANMEFSLFNIGGLFQSDSATGETFYFNGSATVKPPGGVIPVSEPGSTLLFALGVLALVGRRRKMAVFGS